MQINGFALFAVLFKVFLYFLLSFAIQIEKITGIEEPNCQSVCPELSLQSKQSVFQLLVTKALDLCICILKKHCVLWRRRCIAW